MFGTPACIYSDRGTSFMSQEIKNFLSTNGITSSRTTPYNPYEKRQAKRYNGIIWKTIQLALKNKNLSIGHWEAVLNESLLCTATNETPHERMFKFVRRTGNESATSSWLTIPGPILFTKKHVRHSKFDSLVQEVSLIEGNNEYAHIRFPDGRKSTVYGDLAPLPSTIEIPPPSHEHIYAQVFSSSNPTPLQHSPAPTIAASLPQNLTTPLSATTSQSVTAPPSQNVTSRHSSRIRRLPAYFQRCHLGE
ncbi:hypothetical protein ILUMI_08919 [Ignelater luminosus]|uniref:Integrase catalytic domain-containing protein n=1 Tax=Ignelater luminosus TaxID=2038154 RepID=A0A8K0GFJ5_IGNLU|nr:hypothetical protein ILUMI_08919 [Ignelater luminosus]